MHIIQAINKIIRHKPILFTTPGHSGGRGIFDEYKELVGKRVFKADFSEIEGLDNLQNPQGVIKNSLMRSSEIYGSERTFYLINGSTSGIIALMLASVNQGDKIIVARNCHKSVISAITLSGACPLWVNPEIDNDFNVIANIKPEKIKEKLEKFPETKAVWITSPTYDGIVSDVQAIAEICKEKNVLFFVDEAHGAVWNFSDKLPLSSINLGADGCVQSLHKSGSCLNQGAVLHLSKNSRISPQKVALSLNLINTTSPSYLILSSIEASIEYLNSQQGREKLNTLLNDIENIKDFLKNNIDTNFIETCKAYRHDPMKFFISVKGLSGIELGDLLYKKFNIETEMENSKGILAYTGAGTSRKKLEKLAFSLIKAEKMLSKTDENSEMHSLPEPEQIYSPTEAFYKKSKRVALKDAVGLVSKETVVKFPPGIPTIVAGEVIKPEHLNFLDESGEIDIILD